MSRVDFTQKKKLDANEMNKSNTERNEICFPILFFFQI